MVGTDYKYQLCLSDATLALLKEAIKDKLFEIVDNTPDDEEQIAAYDALKEELENGLIVLDAD